MKTKIKKYSKDQGDALGWELKVTGQIDGENLYKLLDHRGRGVDETSWSGKRWLMLSSDENPWKAIPQHYSHLDHAMSLLPRNEPFSLYWMPDKKLWSVKIATGFEVWHEKLQDAILDAFLAWKKARIYGGS